jgi:hypothetical protein
MSHLQRAGELQSGGIGLACLVRQLDLRKLRNVSFRLRNVRFAHTSSCSMLACAARRAASCSLARSLVARCRGRREPVNYSVFVT